LATFVGIFGDDFLGGLLDGGFAHLGAEAFGRDDLGGPCGRIRTWFTKTFLPMAAVILADSTNFTSSARAGRRDRARADFLAGIFQAREEVRFASSWRRLLPGAPALTTASK